MDTKQRSSFAPLRNLALLLLVVSAASCATASVNKVLADPSRYRDKDVTVTGEVSDSFSVMSRGAYRIKDDSGQLWVVSDKGVPRNGARVEVKGKIREGYNFSGFGSKLPAGLGDGLVLVESSHKAR
jgi:hypothetical protein